MSGSICTTREGRFAIITLANPAKRNALSLDVLRELSDAFLAVGESDADGIILAAEGPVFSAGHNFAEMLIAPFGADQKTIPDLLARRDDTADRQVPTRRYPP